MRIKFARFIGSCSGTAAIEFAFIVPIMLFMLAGIVEGGRIFQVYNATNRLATQYAIVFADCSDQPIGTCGTEISTLGSSSASANIAPQLQGSLLTITIFQVSMSGATPNIVYAYPSGSTLTAAQVTAAQGTLTDKQSGVIVTATYNHSLQFFSNLMSPYLASALTASYTAVQLKG